MGNLALSPPTLDADDRMAAAAEEVRAWFVLARGGAPFLSATDGHTLIAWLEAGIPVSMVMLAIEQVARRRAERKTRTPFHLDSCAATLKKLSRNLENKPSSRGRTKLQSVPAPLPNDAPLAEVLLVKQTREQLAALPADLPDEQARKACVIVRAFQEELWELLRPDHARLLGQAAEELEDLREILGPAGMARACEERAREMVKRRYPEFTATRIWEDLGFGA